MDNVKIIIDGVEKEVFGLFYIYESKYYFIYTEKELDENDYVVLYMTQVGKEIQNTENGAIDTGYMIGVEVTDPTQQQQAQTAISYIVEDKKNNTVNPKIQYLPISMLSKLKINSKKRFRLLKTIMQGNFGLSFPSVENNNADVTNVATELQPIYPKAPEELQVNESSGENTQDTLVPIEPQVSENNVIDTKEDENIVIDYRTRFFEEEAKNKELQNQIDVLTQKLNEIKKVIE